MSFRCSDGSTYSPRRCRSSPAIGIRACLVAQDLTQIYAAYGHDEAVTSQLRHDGAPLRPTRSRPPQRAFEADGRDYGAPCAPDGIQCWHQRIGTRGRTVADDAGRGPAAERG